MQLISRQPWRCACSPPRLISLSPTSSLAIENTFFELKCVSMWSNQGVSICMLFNLPQSKNSKTQYNMTYFSYFRSILFFVCGTLSSKLTIMIYNYVHVFERLFILRNKSILKLLPQGIELQHVYTVKSWRLYCTIIRRYTIDRPLCSLSAGMSPCLHRWSCQLTT